MNRLPNAWLGWLLGIFVISTPVAAGATDPDTRQPLPLPPDERHLVLQEMRNFVLALQSITDGLARNDMAQVARAARTMGSGAANEIPPHVVAKLPTPFRQLAGEVHTGFDAIALDADDLGDAGHTLEQMGSLMQHCIACHGMYQIVRQPEHP